MSAAVGPFARSLTAVHRVCSGLSSEAWSGLRVEAWNIEQGIALYIRNPNP